MLVYDQIHRLDSVVTSQLVGEVLRMGGIDQCRDYLGCPEYVVDSPLSDRLVAQ
jgi:hypothetical protein